MKKKHVIPMAVLSSALLMGTVAPTQSHAISENASPKAHAQIQQKSVHKDKDNRPFFVQQKQSEKYTKANENSAKAHLKKNKEKFKMADPDHSLGNAEITKDDLGMTHVKLQQEKNGVPVEGHQVVVHYDKENQVQTVNGQFNEGIEQSDISTNGSLSEAKGLEVAKDAVDAPEQFVESPSSTLVIYPFQDENHLAYKVNVNFLGEDPGNWFVYVDANTGEVIDKYNAIMHADGYQSSKGSGTGVLGDHRNLHISHSNEKGVEANGTDFYLYDKSHENLDGIYTYDGQNSWNYAGLQDKLFSSRDAAFTDDYEKPAVDAHYNSEKVYEYYLEEHDRNSIDGEGMAIKSTVHFGKDYN
ncbi:PepSY domain-containing protein, partial [Halobacillus trueperi]|uniref:PepSY domain-containing protein n=1 Tax=Halobacillus trueperi TaxID=156205 RepID=UPI00216288DB